MRYYRNKVLIWQTTFNQKPEVTIPLSSIIRKCMFLVVEISKR